MMDDSRQPVTVAAWQAWAPGLDSADAWAQWAAGDAAIADDDSKPDVSALPPMFRRRLSTVSRMTLGALYGCLGHREPDDIRTVFGSQHGEAKRTGSILSAIAERDLVSPTAFGLSVHNASSGLFSIATKNRRPATALAARTATFAAAFVEAATQVASFQEDVVLVVVDERLPEIFAEFADPEEATVAVALLLSPGGEGAPLQWQSCAGGGVSVEGEPQTLQFLRWWLVGRGPLDLDCGSWALQLRAISNTAAVNAI
jgi:hypothetical protein